MNPRLNSQIDDIDAIKARNKIAASDPGLQPILFQTREDLETLIDKLLQADALEPIVNVVNEELVVIGYKACSNLTQQFVVTTGGDTLLRSDIIARQARGLSYSRYELKHALTGQSIPLHEFGNHTGNEVYNEVLANLIVSFKPQIKDYVHITLPKCPTTPATSNLELVNGRYIYVPAPQPHDGKNIIFVVGHKASEINERSAKPEVLCNSAAQSLINLHIGTANLHLTELKEYEAAHYDVMPLQTHNDMVDTINGLEMERNQIITRLNQLKTLLIEETREIEGKKEELASREAALLRTYVKPARKHPVAAGESTAQVQRRLEVANQKKRDANEFAFTSGMLCFYGVGFLVAPVAFINKKLKRNTRSDYRAMHAYKEFMDSKLQLFTQYDERLATIEQLTQAIDRGFTAVEVTETTTIMHTQQQEEQHQIVVPSKRI